MLIFNGQAVNRDDYITKDFKYKEFQCKNGDKTVIMDLKAICKLQELRDWLGVPIIVTSAYRSKEYNRKIYNYEKDSKGNYKGDNSQHIKGTALDIKVKGYSPREIAAYGQALGYDGIGVYNTFTHLDTRGYKARWGNTSGLSDIELKPKKEVLRVDDKEVMEIINEIIKPSTVGIEGEWGKVHFNNINQVIPGLASEYRGNDLITRSEVFKIVDLLLQHFK